MKKTVLLALAGIGLFGLGSMLIIYLATEPGPSRPTPPSPAPVAPVTALPATPVAPPVVPPGALPVQQPGPPVVYAPPPPPPPAGSWEAVPPVARPAALGPVGAAIGRGLIELQPRVAACFEATAAPAAPVSTVAEVPTDDHGVTVLMLQIETLAGKARIVDAPVETFGGASEAVVACAQRLLRGQVIPAPCAKPGSRHRILFTLTP